MFASNAAAAAPLTLVSRSRRTCRSASPSESPRRAGPGGVGPADPPMALSFPRKDPRPGSPRSGGEGAHKKRPAERNLGIIVGLPSAQPHAALILGAELPRLPQPWPSWTFCGPFALPCYFCFPRSRKILSAFLPSTLRPPISMLGAGTCGQLGNYPSCFLEAFFCGLEPSLRSITQRLAFRLPCSPYSLKSTHIG